MLVSTKDAMGGQFGKASSNLAAVRLFCEDCSLARINLVALRLKLSIAGHLLYCLQTGGGTLLLLVSVPGQPENNEWLKEDVRLLALFSERALQYTDRATG